MQELLKIYRDRLTDLSKRNISLRLLKLAHKNHCDIATLGLGSIDLGIRVANELATMKPQVVLVSAVGTSEEELVLNRHLTTLKREIDLIEQETGANVFHVAYGFLEGTMVDDFYLRSPLLLYPARLSRRSVRNVPHWVLELDNENEPYMNPSLVLALRKYLGINAVQDSNTDDVSIPKEGVFQYLHSAVSGWGLNVSLGSTEPLLPFPSWKTADIPTEQTGFRIMPYVVMGKFRQSASTLLSDYEELLESPPEEGLLYSLLNETPDESELSEISSEILNEVKEEDTFFVLDTDASQEAAVIASRERQGLVVHGPPGTGKSQVIVNLIADRLARGQKVLVVCQKPVALEVVYNRLSSIGLHHHAALVRDFNRDRPTVYGKIATVLGRGISSGNQGLERMSQEMQSMAGRLNQIAIALHKERPFGKTLRYLYANALWDPNFLIDVKDVAAALTYEDVMNRVVEMKTMFPLIQRYDHPNYPWHSRTDFSALSNRDHMELSAMVGRLLSDVKTGYEIVNLTSFAYSPEYLVRNRAAVESLSRAIDIIRGKNLYKHVRMFYKDDDRELEHEDELRRVRQAQKTLTDTLSMISELPESPIHLSADSARTWAEKLDQFFALNSKFTRFISGAWYGLRKEIREHCESNKILFDGNSLRKYQAGIKALLLYEDMRAQAGRLHMFSDAPLSMDHEEWERWLHGKQHAIEFLELYVEAQTVFPNWLKDLITSEDLEYLIEQEFLTQLERTRSMVEITERMTSELGNLNKFLQTTDDVMKEIQSGIYDITFFQSLRDGVDDFDSMVRLDQMKGSLDNTNQILLSRCQEKVPVESTPNVVEYWAKLIINSFIHQWIEDVEREEPYVADVSTEVYQEARKLYAQRLLQKRKLVPGYIDYRLSEGAQLVRGASRTKIKGEATKKRRFKPLRQVIGAFTDDVLQLIPCWLCTPEVASAIFPSRPGMFDLVIFDEASQCPVENAIPAIYRAKQLVVAGDEKQLPPSRMFRTTDDEDDLDDDANEYKDNTNVEAKSLLEWSKPRLADQWLTWHYRSESDALITFSNYAFYGQRMQTAPAAHVSADKPIEFIRVDGQWLSNQNWVEADKIADLVIELLQSEGNPTLGIITFNAAQTELINDVLDERGQKDPALQALIEQARQRKEGDQFVGLFVKNIENVQGDERDIVLFSVAYAKDERGGMVSQFGSLSQDQGENRLNVAITRARKKVYMVCSFEPSEWTRVDTYASRGPRLLKKYLEYAKAVSDGDQARVKIVLDSLVDVTGVQPEHTHNVYDSEFEEQVATALRNMGYEVHTQVGFSGYRIDLAVVDPRHPDKYVLGIECDGAMYHSSKIARERDFYRQRFLMQHGWNIHRIWSRNWWKSKNKELNKVRETINRLMDEAEVIKLASNR